MDKPKYSILKIKNIPENLLEPIDNIVGNLGITRSQFLRQQFRIICNSMPDNMKFNHNDADKKMIGLENLDPDIKRQIENISSHIGVTQSNYIKMELQKIVNTYPESMKKPPLDY